MYRTFAGNLLHRCFATTTFSCCFFFVAAATCWNKLYANTRKASIFGTFKSMLKIKLFISAYHTWYKSLPTQRF